MNNYKKRRTKLLESLKDNSALLLFSGSEIKKSADGFFDFVANRNFYYLSGIKQENSILFITKIKGKVEEKILTLPYDPHQAVWTGRRLTSEEAKTLSGVATHLTTPNYDELLEGLKGQVETIYLDLEPGILNHKGVETKKLGLQIAGVYGFAVENVYPFIVRQRMVKDDYEVALIKDSIHLTANALKDAIASVTPGKYEYEIAALFEYGIKKHHGELGFSTIAASGEHGVILHYPHLDAKLNKDELLLLDLGGHNNMYTADISRTIPISGKFTPLQQTIYEIVLACNKKVIKEIKPGKTLMDLQNFTREFLKNELVKAKIMSVDEDISSYYYHGVSHHLGLDTHDPSERSLPLEPGNVITVEPGLYFAKHKIGVRIEDNVLVTANGSLNLSIEIPKEIKDIVK